MAGGVIRSSRRWMTSAGTSTAGRIARTSIAYHNRTMRSSALGLAAIRSQRENPRRARSDAARLGAYHSTLSPWPHRLSASSSNAATVALASRPQG